MLPKYVLFLFHFCSFLLNSRADYFTKNSETRGMIYYQYHEADKAFSTDILMTEVVADSLMCSRRCMRTEGCVSVSMEHKRSNGIQCVLHGTVVTFGSNSLEHQTGFIYSYPMLCRSDNFQPSAALTHPLSGHILLICGNMVIGYQYDVTSHILTRDPVSVQEIHAMFPGYPNYMTDSAESFYENGPGVSYILVSGKNKL